MPIVHDGTTGAAAQLDHYCLLADDRAASPRRLNPERGPLARCQELVARVFAGLYEHVTGPHERPAFILGLRQVLHRPDGGRCGPHSPRSEPGPVRGLLLGRFSSLAGGGRHRLGTRSARPANRRCRPRLISLRCRTLEDGRTCARRWIGGLLRSWSLDHLGRTIGLAKPQLGDR